MTSCVQRANGNLQQRRMSRDLHLTKKGTDATQFAATQFCYLLTALGRQCSLMNEQLSRTIIKN